MCFCKKLVFYNVTSCSKCSFRAPSAATTFLFCLSAPTYLAICCCEASEHFNYLFCGAFAKFAWNLTEGLKAIGEVYTILLCVLFLLKFILEVSKQACLQMRLFVFYRFESALASSQSAFVFLQLVLASVMRFLSGFTISFDASEEEAYPQCQENRTGIPWGTMGGTHPLLWNSTTFGWESKTCSYKTYRQEYLCCLGWYNLSFPLCPTATVLEFLPQVTRLRKKKLSVLDMQN